jgi:hypothetical protein
MLSVSPQVYGADKPIAARQQQSAKPLDLSTPPIDEVLTHAQIDAVLSRTVEPQSIEEVEVDRPRVYDPETGTYIPPGFAALFWGSGHPSAIWRLFAPRLAQRSQDIINPTNGAQPAPAIPAMAGEPHPYDR